MDPVVGWPFREADNVGARHGDVGRIICHRGVKVFYLAGQENPSGWRDGQHCKDMKSSIYRYAEKDIIDGALY